MSQAQLIATLKAMGKTPVAIAAQKSIHFGKDRKSTKWIVSTLCITPADQVIATIQAIRERNQWPGFAIVAQVAGGEHYHGRPIEFYETSEEAVAAIVAAKQAEERDALDKAQKKLTPAQTEALKSKIIAEYLKSLKK